MNSVIKHFLVASFILVCWGCNPPAGRGGRLSQPPEARINLADQTLGSFDEELMSVLFRYLASNPRWEIRELLGQRCAVRLEGGDGEYKTTLDGYSITNRAEMVRQTSVVVSFGRESVSFRRGRGNITRAKVGEQVVPVTIEGGHYGQPGFSSSTIIDGGRMFLQIHDQAPDMARTFTQKVYDEMSAELRDVMAHREAIDQTGIMPVAKWYPKPLPKERSFEVREGMGPGIYLVSAAVAPTEPGFAYVKVFNAKTGEGLSVRSIHESSIRYTGWSGDGKTLFPYGSLVIVREGDRRSPYEARFELWHRSNGGAEIELARTTLQISGFED